MRIDCPAPELHFHYTFARETPYGFISTLEMQSQEDLMAKDEKKSTDSQAEAVQVTRQTLIKDLNEDLAREYQAIIAYTVYSQVLKGAAYMSIAAQLEEHAGQELAHALTLAKQIDYLGGVPTVLPKPVKVTEKNEDMLRADLNNESETIRNYRQRIRQCEQLGEYAMGELIREILVQEQDHLIDLATALGIDPPNLD